MTWATEGQRVLVRVGDRMVPGLVQVACGHHAHVVNGLLGLDVWRHVRDLTLAPLPVPAPEDVHFRGCCDSLTEREDADGG